MVNVIVAQLLGNSRGTRFYSGGTCPGWPQLGATTVANDLWQRIARQRPENHLLSLSSINIHHISPRPGDQLVDHRLQCMQLSCPLPTTSDNVVSSIYLCVNKSSSRSSIKMRNTSGPNHDPWGIPPRSTTQPEK